MNKLVITIGVDQNDADWNESSTVITQEQLDKLVPVFKAIKSFKPYKGKSTSGLTYTHKHNWPMGEYAPREDLGERHPSEIYRDVLTEDQISTFSDLLPFGEHGFHSVKSVILREIVKETKYL